MDWKVIKIPLLILVILVLLSAAVIGLSSRSNSEGHSEEPAAKTEKMHSEEKSHEEHETHEEKGEAELKEKEAEETKAKTHEEDEAHEEHHVPPTMYYLQLAALLAIFAFGIFYTVKIKIRGQPKHEGIILAYLVTLLFFAYYILGYSPLLEEYHEAPLLTVLRVLLLLLCGALVTFYGVLGRHDEH